MNKELNFIDFLCAWIIIINISIICALFDKNNSALREFLKLIFKYKEENK